MSAFNDRRRNVKRAYRKKAFQTDMSIVRETVDDRPLPAHSYSTPSHQQTAPNRRGIDPHTYIEDVRPAVEHLDFARMLDSARYPWHMVPKGDSANVIQRQKINLADQSLTDGQYIDVLVLNVGNTAGSDSQAPLPLPSTAPQPARQTENIAAGASSNPGQNPAHPNRGGNRVAGISGTVGVGSPGEVYRISSFGHSEITASNTTQTGGNPFTTDNPLRYQIWVDGELFMEWENFQWSPVTPLESQWHFTQPITVTKQIVLRIINELGNDGAGIPAPYRLDTGTMESCFNGWSEQLSGYVDVAYQQLES